MWSGKVYGEIFNYIGEKRGNSFFFNLLMSKKDERNDYFFREIEKNKNINLKKNTILGTFVNCIVDTNIDENLYILNNVKRENKKLEEEDFELQVDLVENTSKKNINGSHRFKVSFITHLGREGYFCNQKKEIMRNHSCFLKRSAECLLRNNFFSLASPIGCKVAVVTNRNSEAYKDVKFELKKLEKAGININLELFDVGMDYSNLEYQLREADKQNFDFIILCRGGGDPLGLEIFNEVSLMCCLLNIKTPVITGLGHAKNVSIADLVATYYASTPSAAAIRLRNFYLLLPLLVKGNIAKEHFDFLCI